MADRRSIGFEVPADGYNAAPLNGITDYCLYRKNWEVLAVIEIKRIKRNALVGKEHSPQYLTKIEKKHSFRTFGFMTNGDDALFLNSNAEIFWLRINS